VLEHLQGAKPPGGFSMRVMLLLSLPLHPFVLIHVLPLLLPFLPDSGGRPTSWKALHGGRP
jgi:hypothetical protein